MEIHINRRALVFKICNKLNQNALRLNCFAAPMPLDTSMAAHLNITTETININILFQGIFYSLAKTVLKKLKENIFNIQTREIKFGKC